MQVALDILGYKTYHMAQFLENHTQPKLWREYADRRLGAHRLWGEISDLGFTATMDNPMCELFEEQMSIFPNAKVILTKHPKGSTGWAKSFTTLMQMVAIQSAPFSFTFPSFLTWIPLLQDINAVRCIMGTTTMNLEPCTLTYGWQDKPPGWFQELYEMHNQQVASTVPADKLLEYTVTEGWEPLCKFLNKPVPNVPFPHTNDSEHMKMVRYAMLVLIYGWVPALLFFLRCVIPSYTRKVKTE